MSYSLICFILHVFINFAGLCIDHIILNKSKALTYNFTILLQQTGYFTSFTMLLASAPSLASEQESGQRLYSIFDSDR